MRGALALALLLLLLAALPVSAAWPLRLGGVASGSPPPPGSLACDLSGVSCGEAYSLNRAMTAGYTGPLFQVALANTSNIWDTDIATATKYDVPQTSDHVADIAGLNAFCTSGLARCLVSIIYAQIHTGANDLTSSMFRCNATNGAASLELDGAGAHALRIFVGIEGVTTYCNPEYTIAGDALATGITGGSSSSSSVFEVGFTYPSSVCCGSFGISHSWTEPDIGGTDLLVGIHYGNAGGYVNCPASNDYCLFPDLESNNQPSPISLGTAALFTANLMTWNSSTNILGGYTNGAAQWTPQTPQFTMNPGAHVHLGGGGDLTWPAAIFWYEGLITNSDLSAQAASLSTNTNSFYGY